VIACGDSGIAISDSVITETGCGDNGIAETGCGDNGIAETGCGDSVIAEAVIPPKAGKSINLSPQENPTDFVFPPLMLTPSVIQPSKGVSINRTLLTSSIPILPLTLSSSSVKPKPVLNKLAPMKGTNHRSQVTYKAPKITHTF
jgi:hypothetical protein